MERRKFLQMLAAAGAGVACTDNSVPAMGKPWGGPKTDEQAHLLSGIPRPDGILEVYLMGGLTPWDTLYVNPLHGKPNDNKFPNQQWHTFQSGEESVAESFDICGGGGRDMLMPFAPDSRGAMISLGPWMWPLHDRPDITSRMRTLVMHHDFEPHQVATPLMLCGKPRGTPAMCSTASHVQRFYSGLEPDRTTPFSYVLYSEDTETQDEFNIQTASASGLHPASARPLSIRLLADNPLPAQLTREHLRGFDSATDRLVNAYVARYRDALRYPATGQYLPSETLADLVTARKNLAHAPQLANILTPELLAPIAGKECGFSAEMDTTAMGIRLGTDLLTRSEDRARYVTYVDSGIINAAAAGYDTHDHHVVESSRNIVHVSRELAGAINKPGENDPRKLDLNKHMVMITTEFGRTPYEEKRRIRGLNHWPFGYAITMIGGPVDPSRAGVIGSIGPDGRATEGFTPSEFRAALMMTMGMWPFSREGFAIGDVRGVGSEAQGAAALRELLLGYSA